MDKCLVNLDKCAEIQIFDKCHLSHYQWQPRTVVRNCFGKVKKVFEEGFYDMSYYDEQYRTIEKILEYNNRFIDYDNNVVYRKPYVKVYYSNGDSSTFYYETYEETMKVYNYCSQNIKNKYEYCNE